MNNGGGFPVFNLFAAEAYIYLSVLVNPETLLQDSTAYVMVHTLDVGVIGPGLYKVDAGALIDYQNIDFNSFTQIADIQTNELSGDDTLILSCDLNDLTSDPEWGPWPSNTNTIGVIALTMLIDIGTQMNVTMTDMAEVAVFHMKRFAFTPSQNTIPQLLLPQVVPAGPASCYISCYYLDAEENFPLVREIVFDDGTVESLVPESQDYSDSVRFSFWTDHDWSTATLRFSDNHTDFVTVDILNTTSISDEPEPKVITSLQVMPNPVSRNAPVSFAMKLDSATRIDAAIFNIKGQKIRVLYAGTMVSGNHSLVWDGKNTNQQTVSSGIYFARVRAGQTVSTVKLAVIR